MRRYRWWRNIGLRWQKVMIRWRLRHWFAHHRCDLCCGWDEGGAEPNNQLTKKEIKRGKKAKP